MRSVAKSALRRVGYEIRRAGIEPQDAVLASNFENLTFAYEFLFNSEGFSLPANALRPQLLSRLLGTPPSEAYFIIQGIHRTKNIPGDVCEFGVAQGETSALIANELFGYTDRILHLFDSFEGLPAPSDMDMLRDDVFSFGDMDAYQGAMAFSEDLVLGRLNSLGFPQNRYVIHKGFIEDSIGRDVTLPESVSFAYVDLDFYEPIKVALEFLHTVCTQGSIIVVDDYDYFSTGGKAAVDEFVTAMEGTQTVYESVVPDARFGHFAVLTRKG